MALRSFWALLGILVLSATVHAQESSTTTAVGTSTLQTSPDLGPTSPWGVSFFSIGSLSQKQVETGGSSYGLNGYIALNYKLSKTKRVSVRPVFNVNSEGLDKRGSRIESGSSLGDAHLVYSDYELATIGAAGVSSSFKLYLPTSEFSQQIHTIAKFRPETFISYDIGSFSSITWVIKPDFFIQSQTSFEDRKARPRKDGTYPRKTTQLAALEHYLELDGNINKYVSIKPSAGFKEDWYNSGGAAFLPATHNTNAKLALGLDIRPVRGLSFTLIAENLVRVSNRKDAVKFFRPEDNSLVLMTNASL
ncbi:hypothetical protein [Bdellovibrio sp. HCB337]|uniref:hypothetical protein n=1 Tax=Bdellovibrio sp. HCB337 TaxID=3394358 RepID=UPI0039A69CA4